MGNIFKMIPLTNFKKVKWNFVNKIFSIEFHEGKELEFLTTLKYIN